MSCLVRTERYASLEPRRVTSSALTVWRCSLSCTALDQQRRGAFGAMISWMLALVDTSGPDAAIDVERIPSCGQQAVWFRLTASSAPAHSGSIRDERCCRNL